MVVFYFTVAYNEKDKESFRGNLNVKLKRRTALK